ncbi:MAG: prephenate dehydrogenase [Micromonosporaceae bacterium]
MNIAVIGMGLIGGSLLRALAAAGHAMTGFDTDPATRAMGRTGAALAPKDSTWLVCPSIPDAVATAELVVIATPLPAVAGVLNQVAGAGYTGLVTDVVSVKVPLRRLAAHHLRGGGQRLAGFVGGHPLAGRETAGFAATDPALFADCAWALCLDEETDVDEWLTVADLLTGVRARVVPTTAADHDRVVAAVSHVPHLVATALATLLTDPLTATLAAGSFRDGTRVAARSPDLIGAICGGNAGPVQTALDTVLAELENAASALESDDPISAVRDWAAPAHALRTSWPRGRGTPTVLPATRPDLLELGVHGGWVTAVAADRHTVIAVRPLGSPGSGGSLDDR